MQNCHHLYVVGEYHPVNIRHWLGDGDRRYKVVHNLVPSSVDKRSYALEAMCANSTDDLDLETMHQLKRPQRETPKHQYYTGVLPCQRAEKFDVYYLRSSNLETFGA